MDEPNFELIDAGIAALQAKLSALNPKQRAEGIERLRNSFKRWGVTLDAADEMVLIRWAEGKVETADLVSHLHPRWEELASRRSKPS